MKTLSLISAISLSLAAQTVYGQRANTNIAVAGNRGTTVTWEEAGQHLNRSFAQTKAQQQAQAPASAESKDSGGGSGKMMAVGIGATLLMSTLGPLFSGGKDKEDSNEGEQELSEAGVSTKSYNPDIPPLTPMSNWSQWPEEWAIAFQNHINTPCGSYLQGFVSDNGDGFQALCGEQNSRMMTIAQKNLVYMTLFANLAQHESSNDPSRRGGVSPMGDGRYPHGLFQLEASSLAGYRGATDGVKRCCPITNNNKHSANSESSTYNAVGSIKCAITMANQNAKDGHFSKGHSASDVTGAFKYWQPMHEQDKAKKRDIYEKTKGFCKALLNAPRGQEAQATGLSESVIAAAHGQTIETRNIAATQPSTTSGSRTRRAAN